MHNLKKLTIAAAMTTCLMAATNASAESLGATLVWQGTVPEAGSSDKLVITGANGSKADLQGTITANVDGTFKSSILTLEARVNTANAGEPAVAGTLEKVKWTLQKTNITYGNTPVIGTTPAVYLNEKLVAVGESVDAEVIKASINQTAALDASDVGGKAVGASITLMADAISA